MRICRTVPAMRSLVSEWQQAGQRVGLVPTMGYLHEGHLSLVRLARERADVTVVSIFVNPTQFGPNEDLDRYPRDLARDERLCEQAGVDVVFYPDSGAMYAPDHSTWVLEEALSGPLCGATRPGHFKGVTTVVAKLLNIVSPAVAVFGQKDAQQALVIDRMIRDLSYPVEMIVGPIVREPDGVAMSSRNAYLSESERERARAINRGLRAARELHAGGETCAATLKARVAQELDAASDRIDYIELVSRQTLLAVESVTEPCLLAVAAFFGGTRLIDNRFLG